MYHCPSCQTEFGTPAALVDHLEQVALHGHRNRNRNRNRNR